MKDSLIAALGPVLSVVKTIDPSDPGAKAKLDAALPLSSLSELAALVRKGVAEGWLAERGDLPVKWGRVSKTDHPATTPLSIDCVSMTGPGPGHEHPQGEIDLCFAVDGEPTFDGNAPGWTVYAPGSWHVPSVSGGQMDILYFLPGGAIRFGPREG
ncbi:MAG: DUF4863 family protein [Proteobacteria bacterium]|nr:DUF4863 family protein [Pseudomonadota bacterium]MCP4919762.1 DUF4863 family protein [Pseudomonadota bacterium]